jgi:hypothetical protein
LAVGSASVVTTSSAVGFPDPGSVRRWICPDLFCTLAKALSSAKKTIRSKVKPGKGCRLEGL